MKREHDFSKDARSEELLRGTKKAIGINRSPTMIDFFKGLARGTGLPYQKPIDLHPSGLRKKAEAAVDEVGGITERMRGHSR
jgi:hypothetical protein